MGFFRNLTSRIGVWMYGRYGYDALSKFLSVTAIVLMLLSVFVPLFYMLAVVCVVWSCYRTFSKNIYARRAELEKYFKIKNKISGFFKLRKRMYRERYDYKYYKCSRCKAYLKVPKGRGRIKISCPKCTNTFIKKT